MGQGKQDPKGPALSSRGSWGGGGTGKPRTEDQRPKGCTKIWVIRRGEGAGTQRSDQGPAKGGQREETVAAKAAGLQGHPPALLIRNKPRGRLGVPLGGPDRVMMYRVLNKCISLGTRCLAREQWCSSPLPASRPAPHKKKRRKRRKKKSNAIAKKEIALIQIVLFKKP